MKLVHSFSLLCALVNIGSGAAVNVSTGNNIRKLTKTSDNKSAKAKSAKVKSAKVKSVKINRSPKTNSKTLKEKKNKAPKLPTKISLLDCPSVLIPSKSSTKDPLPSDALSIGVAYDHLKVYAEEDGRHSLKGCGAIVDFATGARKAIMCHSGAVLDETGILPSIMHVQLTTCSGTRDMVTDLHVRVDRATSTFNLTDTQAQLKVLQTSSAFRLDVGQNMTINYAGLAVSHPLVKERESDNGRSLGVSESTGTVFTVGETQIFDLFFLKNFCISPSTSEYSFVKMCSDSLKTAEVEDNKIPNKIFCSKVGYTRCMGAGLSVGNKGVCYSLSSVFAFVKGNNIRKLSTCDTTSTCKTNQGCGCAPACISAGCDVCQQGCTNDNICAGSCGCSPICLNGGLGDCPQDCSPVLGVGLSNKLTGPVKICCADKKSCLKAVKNMVNYSENNAEGQYHSFTEDAPNTDSAVSVDFPEESFTFDQVDYANDYAAPAEGAGDAAAEGGGDAAPEAYKNVLGNVLMF